MDVQTNLSIKYILILIKVAYLHNGSKCVYIGLPDYEPVGVCKQLSFLGFLPGQEVVSSFQCCQTSPEAKLKAIHVRGTTEQVACTPQLHSQGKPKVCQMLS